MKTERIAIYGGSFDPPHVGHLLSAAWALSLGSIDGLWVVPTWNHALRKTHQVSFEHRAAMCALAFASLKHVAIDPIERELGEVSRTLVTLQALQKKHPNARFRLLLGADVWDARHQWYRWDEVAELAPPIWVGRAGYPPLPQSSIAMPEVSSTAIRAALTNGKSTTGLIPARVEAYIRENALYRDRA